MRRAQRYFFVSPPLRMRWLVAGSVGPGVTFLSPLSTERARTVWCSGLSGQHQDVAVCGKLRTYAYGLGCLAAMLAGTVGRPVDRALHYMMC